MEWVERTALETGIVTRLRKISPLITLWPLVFATVSGNQRTLAGIKSGHQLRSTEHQGYGSRFPRFSPELIAFLKGCVLHAIESLREANWKFSPAISRFIDVPVLEAMF